MRLLLQDRRKHCPEEGSAAVASIAVVIVLGLVLGIAAALVSAVHHRAHAQGVANLAALAGAVEWAYLGTSEPCARAGEVVAKNGGVLTDCALHGMSVQVTIAVKNKTLNPAATAISRAGLREPD